MESHLEPVQVDVRQKRRNHAALRRSLPASVLGSSALFVGFHDRRFQPHADEMKDLTVRHSHRDGLEQLVVG